MSHDSHGPFQLSGSLATESLKQRLTGQQPANQDQPSGQSAKGQVVDVSRTLVARRTLSEKQFLRQRDKLRFEVLSKVLQDCLGVDVEVLWPQDYFKKRARKRLVDYIDVVRDGLISPMIRINTMLHPVRALELQAKDGGHCTLHLASLLGEHPLTEHVDIDDIPAGIRLRESHDLSAVGTERIALVITSGIGQEGLLNECDGIVADNAYEDGLGASEYEADDLWLEEQNASMADIQFWWTDGDEADLIALGRGIGEVVFVGQAKVSTSAAFAIES